MRKNRIKQVRESIPLSIANLARMAGLVPQTVAKSDLITVLAEKHILAEKKATNIVDLVFNGFKKFLTKVAPA